MKRRNFLVGSSLAAVGGIFAQAPFFGLGEALAQAPGAAMPFDVNWLKQRAENLSKEAYRPAQANLPPVLKNLSYDQFRDIRFRPDKAVWADQGLPFSLQFFHMGFLYQAPVILNEVVGDTARPIPYRAELFNYGQNDIDGSKLGDPGYAGFRVHFPLNRPDYRDELMAFLGASYFRALGRGHRYGKSARGLAVNTAMPQGEEFPIFTEFWLERPVQGAKKMVLHALLDGPSVTGAYRFEVEPGETTVMTVNATVYTRRAVERMGIAPLTSMYFYGENDMAKADDFRPEVHDSDGLQLWTGGGEWIWRPVANPTRLRVSSFFDIGPKGFGLFQRDIDFKNYLDLEARYDLRPSVWVEPIGNWGRGAVQLVEIPTGDETNDNIVAYWVPEGTIEAGRSIDMAFKLHWCTTPPIRPDMAQVVASRTGAPGVPGMVGGVPPRGRKFAIEFSGGVLRNIGPGDRVEAVVTANAATTTPPIVEKMPYGDVWRVIFDMTPTGDAPVELRCFLRLGEAALSETWSYQWTA